MLNTKKLFTLIVFVLLCQPGVFGQHAPKLFKKCLPSIVKISVMRFDGTSTEGTGFFVGEKTVVTCFHIVNNANTLEIKTSDGRKFTVDSIIASNQNTDLIKFTVVERSKSWLKLSNKLPEVGEDVYIIGNPDDYDFSISSGIVSAIRMKNSNQVIQNTAPSSPGNSGSPLLNKRGSVIGVMSYVKFNGQNLNFAATSLNAINIDNDNKIKQIKPTMSVISDHDLDSIVKVAEKLILAKDYNAALNSILPITKFADSYQSIKFVEMIGNCHFFLKDYLIAAQYFEELSKKLHEVKPKIAADVFTYAQTLVKLALCYFVLGNKEAAIKDIDITTEVCLHGLANDALRKELYIILIQQAYTAGAFYKYSAGNKFEACLSWEKAKEFGYKKDEYGLEGICK
jgi:V8-like Glu-specific endopeptidase